MTIHTSAYSKIVQEERQGEGSFAVRVTPKGKRNSQIEGQQERPGAE